MPTQLTPAVGAALKTLLPNLEAVRVPKVRALALIMVSLPVLALVITLVLVPSTITLTKDAGQFWTMVNAVAAVATFAATLGVGAVAWYGLRSLRLAQRDMETRAIREARAMAIARCEEFAVEIIPRSTAASGLLSAAKIPVFVKETTEVRFDPDNEQEIARAKAWWATVPYEAQIAAYRLLNDLEAWAMYFTHELADHKVAERPCAPMFNSMVVQFYGTLLDSRSRSTSGRYSNVVRLFKAWRPTGDRQELEAKQEELIEQLAELQSKKLMTKEPLKSPLGTKVDV